jgi:hypothetical protein
MSATDVFKRLGCPLTGVYSWAGESPDGKRAAFTVWQDEVKRVDGEYIYLIYPTWERRERAKGEASVDSRPNAIEMRDIALRALEREAECFGVMVKAVDPKTLGPRSRESCDERDVRRLELCRDGDRIIAKLTKRVPIRDVARSQ